MRSLKKKNTCDFGIADLDKAIAHGEDYVLKDVNGEQLPICKTNSNELGIASVGVELYFIFLKELILLFLLLTIFALPLIILNYTGGYLNSIEKTSPFEGSTIGNQMSIPADIRSRDDQNATIKNHKIYMYITIFFDFTYSLIYVVFANLFECYNLRRLNKTEFASVNDFSIMVELEKGVTATESDLRRLFEKYGTIHECYIVKYYGKTLRRFIKFEKIERKVFEELTKPKPNQKKIYKLKDERADILDDIKNDGNCDNDRLTAFIIFESMKSRDDCLQEYFAKNLKDQNEAQRFKGKPVSVKVAPNPAEIYWENLSTKICYWRTAAIYMTVIYALLIALIIICVVEYYKNQLPTSTMCLENYGSSIGIGSDLDKDNDNDVMCFCGGLDEDLIATKDDYDEFCAKYKTYFIGLWIIRLTGTIVIALVNMILKEIIRRTFI